MKCATFELQPASPVCCCIPSMHVCSIFQQREVKLTWFRDRGRAWSSLAYYPGDGRLQLESPDWRVVCHISSQTHYLLVDLYENHEKKGSFCIKWVPPQLTVSRTPGKYI